MGFDVSKMKKNWRKIDQFWDLDSHTCEDSGSA